MGYKKRFLVTLVFFLSACNLPGQSSAEQSVDAIVNTMAAQTAAAAFKERTATQAALNIPTDTPIPTETPTPTETSTETPTATPTRTSVPNDPRNTYGNPSWSDNFDSSANWYTYDSGSSRAEVRDGKFYYTMTEATGRVHWSLSGKKAGSFYMEVTVQTPEECSGKDSYGIIFRAPDTSQGYLLAFSCDGSYQVSTWVNGTITYPIPWKTSAVILAGPNQTNRLGIRANRELLTVYANGVALNTAADQTFLASGRFGFFISAETTPNFTVGFDDMMLWALP